MKVPDDAGQRLWRELRGALLRFTRSRVPSQEIAEDIVHDVFVKMTKRIDTLKDEERLQSWGFRIARNAIADYYRKKKSTTQLSEQIEREDEASQENNYNDEVASWLPRFLAELPDSDREILTKVEIEGASQKELAASQGLAYSALKSRVQRARVKLKDLLENCCRIELDRHGNVIDYSSKNCDC